MQSPKQGNSLWGETPKSVKGEREEGKPFLDEVTTSFTMKPKKKIKAIN